MKTFKAAIQELKNSNLIPSDAGEFRSKIIIRNLLNYSPSRGESFYRTLSLIAEKTPLQIKHLEQNNFHSFYTLLKKASFFKI